MKKNFRIGQSNELIQQGIVYDLHNMYDFVKLVFTLKSRNLQLLFEPCEEYKDLQAVRLIFEQVDYLVLSPDFFIREVTCLDEVGYKSPGDHDDEWLMNEQQATCSDHLFFRMLGGNYIRIHSQHAFLETGM